MAGEGAAPVRRRNQSAIWAGVTPRSIARAMDAALTTYLPPAGRSQGTRGIGSGKLVGNPGQLGVDQEVGPRRVEGERHAVGLDQHAFFRWMPVISRAAGPDLVGGNLEGVFDQQKPVGHRHEGVGVVLAPEAEGLVSLVGRAKLDQGGRGVERDPFTAARPTLDGIGHERGKRAWLCRARISSI